MDRTESVRAEKEPVDFRHLPPRVTPDEMVEVKPQVRQPAEPYVGNDTEWQIRMSGGG